MKTKISALLLAVTLAFCSFGVYAAETGAELSANDGIQVILTDVTDTDTTVLEGEAKIKVSVAGAEGNGSIAQVSLSFDGDLKYKSITFLQGENNPPSGVLISPNAALANSNKKLIASIISMDGEIEFSETTDLFVLTFEGEPGDEVSLTCSDTANTWVIVDGNEINAKGSVTKSASATEKANAGKTAVVQLEMEKVTDFKGPASSGYRSSNVELTITSESNPGYTIYTILNNANISKGGHRVGASDSSVPTFVIENTVLADDTYTVELKGIGYVPYVVENVDFDDVLLITNEDFVPGDVDGDGKVTEDDMAMCQELIDAKDYSEAADFNRDDSVDRYDLAVYDFEGGSGDEDDNEDTSTAPAKIADLKAEGGEKKVTLTWTAPDNGGKAITSYTVKYGTDEDKLDKTAEAKADATSIEIADLTEGTTYYFSVAAVNEIGTAEAATASAKTASDAATAPDKITEISAEGGEKSITLSWTVPDDGGSDITGYTIKYGTSTSNLSSTKTASASAKSYTISGLTANKTYYAVVAAKNSVGTADFSKVVNAKTSGSSGGSVGGGSTGGGSTGGGSIGGGSIGGGSAPVTPVVTNYTVAYDIGEGKLVSGGLQFIVQQNAKADNAPTVEPPAGKVFAGWSRDGGLTFITPANVTVMGNITFTAIYKDASETPDTTAPAGEVFTDLGAHEWAKESIYTLKNKGVINGTSDTTFSPANNIKRGDFILILVRMLGVDAEYTENFADVPADSYYADAIGKAKAAGIANGYEDNTFKPEDTITRQDLITLAYRAFLAKGYISEATDTASLDEFGDKANISDYAVPAMSSMVKAGIIKGSEGNVNPKNNATRAEVAVMCARLLALMG